MRAFTQYWSDYIGRRIIIVLVVTMVACLFVGIVIDKDNFLGNILAELVGNSIAIGVGLLVIDNYARRQRELRWLLVRKVTLSQLMCYLMNILKSFHEHIFDKDVPTIILTKSGVHVAFHWQTPNKDVLYYFINQYELLDELPVRNEAGESIAERLCSVYTEMLWELDRIQAVIIPRVIESAAEQKLVETLIDFEDMTYYLMELRRNLDEQVARNPYGGQRIAKVFLRAALDLYDYLLVSWESD